MSFANFLQRRFVRQFVKFGITGSIGAVVDFSTYYLLTRVIGWTTLYHIMGYEVIAANMVSVFLAVVSNFILNKYWTFRDRENAVMQQWAGYFVLNTFTWFLNQVVTSFFTFRVPLMTQLFGNQKDFVAKILAIGVILILNFIGSKFLVFRQTANSNNVPNY